MRSERKRLDDIGFRVSLWGFLLVFGYGYLNTCPINSVGLARQAAARYQVDGIMTALLMYDQDTGRFPTTEQGLQALRVKPVGVDRWDGPYLPQDIPNDPWGRAYLYKYPSEHGEEPDIISHGADGKEGGSGEDADVLCWKH